MTRSTNAELSTRSALLAERKAQEDIERKKTLVGKKIGKHKVGKGEVDVQLTDELSESLRALQVSLPGRFLIGP